MIVSMKKLHLIVQKKDIESTLNRLAGLGSVHLEHCQTPSGDQVATARETVEILDQVIDVLEKFKSNQAQEECADWKEKATEILDLQGLLNQHMEFVEKRKLRIEEWEPWGEFEPQDIRDLACKGIFVHLYQVTGPTKNMEVPLGVVFKEVSSTKKLSRYVAILESNENLDFDRVYPPPVSLERMKLLQKEEQVEIDQMKKLIGENTKFLDQLIDIRDGALDQLSLKEAEYGMSDESEICYLKGFIPEESVSELEKKAHKEQWGMLVEEPSDDDNVPTLLKNPKWIELSKPAINMIEILPAYAEIDVSMVFLFFFTLFFGMLIGDAGYGAVFAGVTLFLHFKFGKKLEDKTPFFMGYLLTGFTIIFGVLSGSYFGQAWLPESVKPIVPWLTSTPNVMWMCFTIALVHLSIARIWAAAIKYPSITALSEVGWLFIVWGMYFMANMFVLGHDFPAFAKVLFLVGIPLGYFFAVPLKHFKKNAFPSLIPFILSVISAGTDVISYIRLFAVGLATIAVADAANSMLMEMGGPVGFALFAILHLLNLILALLAVLVHAIRLNVLEFSGHLGLQWLGFKYNPFKLKIVKST